MVEIPPSLRKQMVVIQYLALSHQLVEVMVLLRLLALVALAVALPGVTQHTVRVLQGRVFMVLTRVEHMVAHPAVAAAVVALVVQRRMAVPPVPEQRAQ